MAFYSHGDDARNGPMVMPKLVPCQSRCHCTQTQAKCRDFLPCIWGGFETQRYSVKLRVKCRGHQTQRSGFLVPLSLVKCKVKWNSGGLKNPSLETVIKRWSFTRIKSSIWDTQIKRNRFDISYNMCWKGKIVRNLRYFWRIKAKA